MKLKLRETVSESQQMTI